MKHRTAFGMMSFVLAAGVVDSLALLTVVFASIVNIYGNHPMLSVGILLWAAVMVVVLALSAVIEQR